MFGIFPLSTQFQLRFGSRPSCYVLLANSPTRVGLPVSIAGDNVADKVWVVRWCFHPNPWVLAWALGASVRVVP